LNELPSIEHLLTATHLLDLIVEHSSGVLRCELLERRIGCHAVVVTNTADLKIILRISSMGIGFSKGNANHVAVIHLLSGLG
jgi:hypothetical protein